MAAAPLQARLGPSRTLALLPILGAAGWLFFAWLGSGGTVPARSAPRWRCGLGVAAALLGVVIFAAGYHIALAHGAWMGHGEGLDRAAAALLAGRNPYAARVPPGEALTQLPGAVLLAIPFHAMGRAALQNPFWLAIFMLWLFRRLPDARRAGALACAIFANPGMMQDYMTGGDSLTDGIVLLLALDLVLEAYGDEAAVLRRGGALVALAVALSIHPTQWIAVPIVALYIGRRRGSGAGLRAAGALVVLLAAINLPLYFIDPASFRVPAAVAQALSLGGMPPWLLAALAVSSAALMVSAPLRPSTVLALTGLALAAMGVPAVLWGMATQGLSYYASYLAGIFLLLAVAWLRASPAPPRHRLPPPGAWAR